MARHLPPRRVKSTLERSTRTTQRTHEASRRLERSLSNPERRPSASNPVQQNGSPPGQRLFLFSEMTRRLAPYYSLPQRERHEKFRGFAKSRNRILHFRESISSVSRSKWSRREFLPRTSGSYSSLERTAPARRTFHRIPESERA